MKDLIRQEVEKQAQPSLKKLVCAEFLQHVILQSMNRLGGFKNCAFTGGTALRILYHTARYSEDLDFSRVNKSGFEFRTLLGKIQRDLQLQQLGCELHFQEEKTISRADIRFPGLLKEFNISPLKEQKLTVKFEVDKDPPKGGRKEIALVTSPISYTVTTFDLTSLFATKLHALFFRRYVKGRDYYDLAWFLNRRIIPNFKLLNNAIRQTEGKGHEVKAGEFKKKLSEHLESIDFSKVRTEVERFLIHREELKFLAYEPIKSLLRNYK